MDTQPGASFGELLRQYRLAAGLTQEELAERAHLSPRAISDLERGQRTHPWRDTIQFLGDALHLESSERATLKGAARRASHPALEAVGRGPLKDVSSPPNNLPIQVTSFVGRERELAEVKALLGSTHLLTLTGSGGCGKTRLALHVVISLVDDYPDGVWLVELAPLVDPELVAGTIAVVLGVREGPGQPIEEMLLSALRTRHLLLLLDNCEHLVGACAQLVDRILRRCPGVWILATSREALRIAGEVSWQVPSLGVPRMETDLPLEAAAACEAVRLFVERAGAVQPGFVLTPENAPAIAQICARLDGIPLAIELAATRVKALSVEQIAARLDQRFRLLTGGSRAALPRHQTLRTLVDWSYDLLTGPEQTLFNRLSVFVGGFTLEAAEAVCSDAVPADGGVGQEDVLDLLTQLVGKSLVVAETGTTRTERYRLLETLRQYGQERLMRAGAAEELGRRHATYYLSLAEEAEPFLFGPQQLSYLARLAGEIANLRAALRWYMERRQAQPGLRLCLALNWFLRFRGLVAELRVWLCQFLALPEASERNALRARALGWAGTSVWTQSDAKLGRRMCEEAISIAREVRDCRVVAETLLCFGQAADRPVARKAMEESLGLYRTLGDLWGISYSLTVLGRIAHKQGDPAQARTYLEESLRTARRLGERRNIAYALEVLGEGATPENESGARAYLTQSLMIYREVDMLPGLIVVENLLGSLESFYGHYASAEDHYQTSLHLGKSWVWTEMITQALDGLAVVAAARGSPERVLRLAGASAHLRGAAAQQPTSPGEYAELQKALIRIRESLGIATHDVLWAEGQAMTFEQAIAYALQEDKG